MSFEVSSYSDLKEIKNHLTEDIVLTRNIDASESKYENAVPGFPRAFYGFEPAAAGSSFTGTFDGRGHTISNLYINRNTKYGTTPAGYNSCSMLGTVNVGAATGRFIKDVNILNAEMHGWEGVAVLASHVQADAVANLVISNVTTSGIVDIERSSAGGFISGSSKITVNDCSTSASVTKSGGTVIGAIIGGFCGNIDGNYTNCSAAGSVSVTLTDTTHDHVIGGFSGNAGAIAGETIQECFASGDVTVNISTTGRLKVGGFVGVTTTNSAITLCFAYGNVRITSTSPANAGGFVGENAACDNISRCGAKGDIENATTSSVTWKNCSGGFVGYNTSSDIANCFAEGSVCSEGIGHADTVIGGFCGQNSSATLTHVYSSGAVYAIGTPTNGGGLIGLNSSGTYTNCFWDNETSGWGTSDGGLGKSTKLMKTKSTFTDWDFDAIWELPSFTRSPGSGQSVWFSRVDDYDDFGAGLNDSDPFNLRIASTETILWLGAIEALIVGTGGSEWKIGTNDLDCAITPTNWKINEQTNFGSKKIQPLKVNTALLFVDFVGRKIREMVYNDMERKFFAPDMSELAEHITLGGITSLAGQKNPDSIVWSTIVDAAYNLSMTYNREQEIVAWARHPVGGTDVKVLSVAVVPGANEDKVWVAVQRTINGSTKIYVEQYASRTFTAIEDCFFVDSGITYEGVPTSVISNLDHLEGETVKVLADGVVFDDATVSSGQIILQLAGVTTTAEKVHVGLAYTSILQPLKPVINTQMGSSAASITHAAEMGISLLNSAGVKYGASTDDLFDIDLDKPDWTNLSDISSLFTGTVVVTLDGGFSLERPLIISTSSPLPLTVRALVPRMDVTGR